VSTAALTYTVPERRAELLAEVESSLLAATRAAEAGSDAQLQLVTAWASFASSEESVRVLRDLLSGAETLPGLTVDQDIRWTLVTALATAGAADEAVIAAERERDNTATGREKAARALAARPTAEAKAEAWRAAVESDELPNAVLAATALGFGRVHDTALLEPYVERYHEQVASVWDARTHHIAESIAVGFYPMALADQRLLDATSAWLDANSAAPSGLRRTVAESRDAVARAVAAQERDADSVG